LRRVTHEGNGLLILFRPVGERLDQVGVFFQVEIAQLVISNGLKLFAKKASRIPAEKMPSIAPLPGR